MLRPTFSGKLVSYFEPHTTVTRNEAILYGVGLLFCSFTLSLFNPTYLMVLEQICLKIRIAICSVLYRKCLKLNLVNSSEFASGTAVILMTKDVARFEAALDHIHMMSAGIFQLMILTYLMYREIGVASLIGTSILFIMVPILGKINFKIIRLFGDLYSFLMINLFVECSLYILIFDFYF